MAYTTLFYALIAIFSLAPSLAYDVDVPPSRPVYSDRTFHSSSVDAYLSSRPSPFTSPKLATLFENTFPNTLDTTVSDPETGFIITGDITAMWLRDACNQVQVSLYLVELWCKLLWCCLLWPALYSYCLFCHNVALVLHPPLLPCCCPC